MKFFVYTFVVTIWSANLYAQNPQQGSDQLSDSSSKDGIYEITETRTKEVTVYAKEEQIRWYFNRKRRCWYKCRVIVKVPKTETREYQITKSVIVPAVRGQNGARHAGDSLVINAPDSAGVIDARVESQIQNLFQVPKYKIVRVNTGGNLLDFRSLEPLNNSRVQILVEIDPINPKKVTIDVFGLNIADPAQSQSVADAAFPIAKNAIEK